MIKTLAERLEAIDNKVKKLAQKYEIIKSKQVDHLKNEVFILNSFDFDYYTRAFGIA